MPPHLANSIHHISHLPNPPPTFLRASAIRSNAKETERGWGTAKTRGPEADQDRWTKTRWTRGLGQPYQVANTTIQHLLLFCMKLLWAGTRGPKDQKIRGLGQPYQGPQTRANVTKKNRAHERLNDKKASQKKPLIIGGIRNKRSQVAVPQSLT